MGMLVEGKWETSDFPRDAEGRFVRERSKLDGWVDRAEAGRYHLYAAWACPWAHRALIVRKLRKLEDAIGLSVVDPFMGDDGWFFSDHPGSISDTVNGKKYLRDIYLLSDPKYTGRVTTPVLWDRTTRTIVSNDSRRIIRMFDTVFMSLGDPNICFAPQDRVEAIDALIDRLYDPINNGVYRAGFAASQEAYLEAVTELFEALDYWEEVLAGQRYLAGSSITEADWCFFTTLLRFDLVYHGHFKCNLRRIVDYRHLYNYLKDLYQQPGVRDTCHFDHIKQHYYRSHRTLNPTGIVPKGPLMALGSAHDRGRFSRES
jgi:putative glutathione S-transferase